MPPSLKRQSTGISIVGAGTLATALATALDRQGFPISEIISRDNLRSFRRARSLAKSAKGRASKITNARFEAALTWICVPDDAISDVAEQIAGRDWKGKIVVHSSGALVSDVLHPLAQRGAQVASAHPLMTFVNSGVTDLRGVPFAMEGDAKALAVVGAVVRKLGGKPFRISPEHKPAYHAFGFFCSPAIVALIAAAQQVARLAGLSERRARELMEPIVRQTIENCFQTTPGKAFSGPLRRGDAATIRKHIEVLRQEPELLELYRALSRIALRELPVGKPDELKKLIG